MIRRGWCGAVLLFVAASADAVILFGAGDPGANTSEPTGALAGSGWQYEGQFGSFLGTPIAPRFFITAKHIGGPAPFVFRGVTYTPVRQFPDPAGGDFAIWQIAQGELFPAFAPMYSRADEAGRPLVVIGRGTQRGGEVLLNGELRGWFWGAGDGVQRWGTNVVAQIVPFGLDDDGIAARFDANVSPNEAHLSVGDSGGAVFIQDGAAWKLGGINYAVDDLYFEPNDNSQFFAAVFDARGFYERTGYNPSTFALIQGANPVPTAFYATRISSKLPWIYSVIDPFADNDADGTRNLLEYALHLDPLAPDAGGLPKVAREGSFLTLTYTKRRTAADLAYAVEQSFDLLEWNFANAQEQVIATNGAAQTIKASVPIGNATRMFLRLRVTRQ